ncbi:hypothetical protein E2C01_058120 [Portunus trituberculatus]|uniref:R-spondin Fu-CRD domain-containing protein n=1 Tax=Portunus trituberculatus TaxID=210409 RepID=A0A5B7GVC3_PORTR|nr:hypothetical protein [Portunus trituberculatus]
MIPKVLMYHSLGTTALVLQTVAFRKCMLRGCSECTTRHYCSICKAGLVRHAGRCRKKCPFGTEISPRTPGLCLSSPTPPTGEQVHLPAHNLPVHTLGI